MRPIERPPRCADAAQLAADPPEATAPPADEWLLVEHPGPWGPHALTDSRLHPAATAALARWTTTSRARVALIRRPGPPSLPGPPRRWFRVDCRAGRESIRAGWFTDERELVDVMADPAAGAPSAEPIYLVCTHGRHDTCCAVRGRPVAAALANAFPERTWECTHVGGDRFAANLVLLPHGLYYGQVAPDVAIDVVRRYHDGLVHPQLLRGRSSVPQPAQAAQHHARLALGDAGVDSLAVLGLERRATSEWTVLLRGPDGAPVTVTVRARLVLADRPLTCADTTSRRFRVFDLVALHHPSLECAQR